MRHALLAAAALALSAGVASAQVPTPDATGMGSSGGRPAVEGKVNSTTKMNAVTPDQMNTGQVRTTKMKKKKRHNRM